MRDVGSRPAICWRGRTVTYDEFLVLVDDWCERLNDYGIQAGTVCAIVGEFSPRVCTLIFALMRVNAVVVPLTRLTEREMRKLMGIAGVDCVFRFDAADEWSFETLGDTPRHELVERLAERRSPGLVVFTSGSTGEPKGILHDCERVLSKFLPERPGRRTVLFLMFDHFGGLNTLFSALAHGGVGICLHSRTPDSICEVIEETRATLLPTTPTFLNLLIASGAWQRYDLSSLELITYGTELMPEATLERVRAMFPGAAIKQTYGLSELGVLSSASPRNDSTWLRIGGDGFETKVRDGVLWIRSQSSMVGYLNHPTPFDDDGWMCTGDEVEVQGDLLRFVGRQSEIINVGGQKVFPAEVESILLEAENVLEATVFGVPHVVLGQVPCARVSLDRFEDNHALNLRLRAFCKARLNKFKVPVRIDVVDMVEHSTHRHKKIRDVKDASD